MDFVEIDLSEGDKKSHPAFNEEDYFLVEKVTPVWRWEVTGEDEEGEEIGEDVLTEKVETDLHFGQFREVWYGWNFDCGWGASGFQYDQPGSNHSDWHRCWKLVGYEAKG